VRCVELNCLIGSPLSVKFVQNWGFRINLSVGNFITCRDWHTFIRTFIVNILVDIQILLFPFGRWIFVVSGIPERADRNLQVL